MARGRRPHGRSAALNPGRITRTAGKILAASSDGSGRWRRTHDTKSLFPTFCRALRTERAYFRDAIAPTRVERRDVYPCRYGSHWLIESATRHWHIGRSPC
jgi:hypothetical protein